MKLKHFVFTTLALTALTACGSPSGQQNNNQAEAAQTETSTVPEYSGIAVEHTFAALPYAYDALEPYIDAQTMELHYSRHHQGYYNNFMKALEGTGLENASLEFIFEHMSKLPTALRNNGGGYYNHSLFWSVLAPGGQGAPSPELSSAIEEAFGSMEAFQEQFNKAATGQFGSGWAWLLVKTDDSLAVSGTPNQDNPLMDVAEVRGTPILALDVWEHAYYLKYQNKRGDYVASFWNLINWEEVNHRYLMAIN